MKSKSFVLVIFLITIMGALHAQEAPVKDFRLPNDELVTLFIGGNTQGPYIQCINYENDQFAFESLCENAAQAIDISKGENFKTCGTHGNFDANDETTEMILATIREGKIALQHAVVDQSGTASVTGLQTETSWNTQAAITSGYFTPEAKVDHRKEVAIGSWGSGNNTYVKLHGFRFTNAGNESYKRIYNKKLGSKSIVDVSSVDVVACDYDGDGFDEVCLAYGHFSWALVWISAIKILAFDWTPKDQDPIPFPLGEPDYHAIKEWKINKQDRPLVKISAGDVDNDGKEELVIFKELRSSGRDRGFNISVFKYDTDGEEWTQMEFDNMEGTLLAYNTLFNQVEVRDWDYDTIQLDVCDLDYNGCCDIAASLTYKTPTSENLHYWIYTFELDAVEGVVVKERANYTKSNTGLHHAMVTVNMDNDQYNEIYYITDSPKLFSVTFDTLTKAFKEISLESTTANNFQSSIHGFEWPFIIPVDIDKDSYWCRYKPEKFNVQNATPFIGKPVAIITPPPFQEGLNDNTFISVKFKTAHDTLASVQSQAGYGYDSEIELSSKWAGTKAVFRQIFEDTVRNYKEYYEGNMDNDSYKCHNLSADVIFHTSGYDIYPYRVETLSGDPVKSDEGTDIYLYIMKPKDSGTHLEVKTWNNYLTEYEASYGSDARQNLVDFMAPFMQYSPGNVPSYCQNANPYFLYTNLGRVFPTMEQEINTSHEHYEKEWGKSERADELCERSRRWETRVNIDAKKSWGPVSARAHLRFFNFTTTQEMIGEANEDGVIMLLHFNGVGVPNTADDEKYYRVTTFAFWGPKESGLDGAIIVTHNVSEMGSYYGTTNVEKERVPKLAEFNLSQNFPNPFNPTTMIEFTVKEQSRVRLVVYNLRGRKIAVLVDESMSAGQYAVEFDAADLPSGLYFYKIQMGEYCDIKKMVLNK